MALPKYQPNQYVIFQYEGSEATAFGYVVSGQKNSESEEWLYTINTGSQHMGSAYENQITHVLKPVANKDETPMAWSEAGSESKTDISFE